MAVLLGQPFEYYYYYKNYQIVHMLVSSELYGCLLLTKLCLSEPSRFWIANVLPEGVYVVLQELHCLLHCLPRLVRCIY